MTELLDKAALNGPLGVVRALFPTRHAVVVPTEPFAMALETVAQCFELWCGAAHILVPRNIDGSEIDESWVRLVRDAEVDAIQGAWTGPPPIGFFAPTQSLLVVLASAPRTRAEFKTVQIPRLPTGSPWALAYAAVLGIWPDEPSPVLRERFQLRPEARFDNVIPTEVVDVESPGGDELLGRLLDRATLTPAQINTFGMSISAAPRSGRLGRDTVLPWPNQVAEEIGPNIVVVYTPESVADLCLLWDLRAANGLETAPLGVPVTEDVVGTVRSWWNSMVFRGHGWGGAQAALVSCSVDQDQLKLIADELGSSWRVVSPSAVLRAADVPTRMSTDVAVFASGEARLAAWAPADQDAFSDYQAIHQNLGLGVRVTLTNRHLPASASLRGPGYGAQTYRGGGAQFEGPDPHGLVDVRWPTNWTVFRAVARDRGLDVRPSDAGAAGAALLRRLGGSSHMLMLADPGLLALLNRLGEQSGMSWLRARWREFTGTDPAGAVEDDLRRFASMPTDEDRRKVQWGDFRSVLRTNEATEAWLHWAEEKGLLIRGARIKCESCQAGSWRAVGELAPPVICRGCGDPIRRPFPAKSLPWDWRAAQIVVQATFYDVMPHLLACSWLAGLFHRGFDKPEELFGFYPGVIFNTLAGAELGEADVVLLFTNGDIVLGECKRNGAGLKVEDLSHLDALAKATAAPWTFIATPSAASDCPPIWSEAIRQLPDPPRFALTGEHLFNDPLWVLGSNPLAWRERHTQVGPPARAFNERVVDLARWLTTSSDPDSEIIEGWDEGSSPPGSH